MPSVSLNGVSVLVIDDNADVRELVFRILRSAGADVAVAPQGESGLGWVEWTRFDVVVLDLNMPGLSGHEVLARIGEAGHRGPVVVYTADERPETQHRVESAGAVFLPKRLGKSALIQAVNQAAGKGDRWQFDEPSPPAAP